MKYRREDRKEINFTTILENEQEATLFQHFKGKKYKILTIAKDSETLEDMVIYQGQYGDKPCWGRKIEEFFSKVDKKKYPNIDQEDRFQIIEK